MHPLRQTSFPTSLDQERSFGATSDAGSITGSFTGSLGGTSADGVFSAARGKKRGRKSKAEKEREREDAMSTRTGDAGRGGSADVEGSMRGGIGGGGGADEGDEDDDDDEGDLLGRDEGTTDVEAEKKNLAYVLRFYLFPEWDANVCFLGGGSILVEAFNPQQSERYDLFKRAKLRKESLRRIVNHALSQSVPASVVTTVNGFTKVFAGEMIEKARTVQAEWADAHDQAARAAFEAEEEAADKAAQAKALTTSTETKTATPTPSGTPVPQSNGIKKESPDISRPGSANLQNNPSSASPAPANHAVSSSSIQHPGQNSTPISARPRREFRPPPNPHRGQLLPSHMREALRRFKRDGESGGVGFSGLSMDNLQVKGAFTWNSGTVGGRRLFR